MIDRILNAGIVVAAVLLVAFCAFSVSSTKKSEALSLQDPVKFVKDADALLDRMGPVKADTDLDLWALEILPWFAEEGIIGHPVAAPGHYEWFQGTDANHLLGYTSCFDFAHITSRYANPVDPWYRDPELVFTLAHELAHLQQGPTQCMTFSSPDVENSAQLMAAEVTAAMALNGNRVAMYALLTELRGMVIGYLRYQAWGNHDKTVELNRLLRQIYTPAELADTNQRWMEAKDDMATRKGILYRYSFLPVKKLIAAEKSGLIPGLVLGQQTLSLSESIPSKQTLTVDDLLALLKRAPGLV